MCINCAPVALGVIGVIMKNSYEVLSKELASIGIGLQSGYADPICELFWIYFAPVS